MDIDDAGQIHTDQLLRTSADIAAKHKRSELREGDVLLCVIRHLRVAIVPAGIDGANLTQGTVRMRPSDQVLGPYLAQYLASPQAQSWMKDRYVGTDMPRINVEHAQSIPVPLPPIPEQQEIVRRVGALLARADGIAAKVTAARQRVDAMTQAVLAKAFRGELVPTEAELARRKGRDYEPASALLNRIRAERATATPAANGQRRRRAAR
jgi:type I restriction enzyme S subunit